MDGKELTPSINVIDSNEDCYNIRSLPLEMIIKIFGYMTQNELGGIARVCKQWEECAKCPVLWKKVDVKFPCRAGSQTKIALTLCEIFSSCMTHLKLDFSLMCHNRVRKLQFTIFCAKLKEKCPELQSLILRCAQFSVNLSLVIDLCAHFLPKLEVLVFYSSKFCNHFEIREHSNFCNIDISTGYGCNTAEPYSSHPFPKILRLKKLCLVDNLNIGMSISSFFDQDLSFMNQIEIVNLHRTLISGKIFQKLSKQAFKLTELYLCENSRLVNQDFFRLKNSEFPFLKTICLAYCFWIRSPGIICLVQKCPSLQELYLDRTLAKDYSENPAVVANPCLLDILNVRLKCPHC